MTAIARTLAIVTATHEGTDIRACNNCRGAQLDCGAVDLFAGVQAVLDLHQRIHITGTGFGGTGEIVCGSCFNPMGDYVEWPCATVRLLTGQEA